MFDSATVKNQSNPFSTGGGGVNFETRVQAAFTVLMLTGSVAPCLPAFPIQKIKLQGKYSGFNTDDFIVFVQHPESKAEAKLLAQIKHAVSITDSDPVFADVIVAAWHDFNSLEVFTEGIDTFALISGPLSAKDIKHTRPILEWARHCESAEEFVAKAKTPKLSSKTKQEKLNAFKSQLKAANGDVDVTDEILWRFLKSFYLIGYDLDTDTGSSLSLLHSLLKQNVNDADVDGLWAKIVMAVQSSNQNAGTLTFATIPDDIRSSFLPAVSASITKDIFKLAEHGGLILRNIQSEISGIHVDRKDLLLELLAAIDVYDFVLVTGAKGNGKSGAVQEIAEHLKAQAPVFCLRTEDLNKPHLDNVFTAIGMHSTISELTSYFALMPRKYLLLESIEKLLELECKDAFDDLLNFIAQNGAWTIIATGRDYAYQQLTLQHLNPKSINWISIEVPEFSESEAATLFKRIPQLHPLGNSPEIKKLIRNPFMASLAVRVGAAGACFAEQDGEVAFRRVVWSNVIANESYRKDGMPVKRKQAFIDIAVTRAKAMVYGIPEDSFDAAAVFKLEEDHLIWRDTANGLVCPAHDILEDWALIEYIDIRFKNHGHDINGFVDSVGFQPAMNRAFRLWLHQKLKSEPDSADIVTFITDVIRQQIQYWQDEAITAIFMGNDPFSFLFRLRDQLFENNGALLKRFCFILRISCKAPDRSFIKQLVGDDKEVSGSSDGLWMMPYGHGWNALIRFLYENIDKLTQAYFAHVTALLNEWSSQININNELPELAREAGLIGLHFLEFVKNDYNDGKTRKELLGVIIRVIPVINQEFQELLEKDYLKSSERRQPHYLRQLLPMLLVRFETGFLCKHNPDLLIRLTWKAWFIEKQKIDHHYPRVEECFGLHNHREGAEFFPASGAKGPFAHLLLCHPRKALDYILELLNRAAEKYAHSRLDSDEKPSFLPTHYPEGVFRVELNLNDGTKIIQYCSHRLWCGYRGTAVLPYLLQSALMALENWFIRFVEDTNDAELMEWLFDHILRNSNSVMPTAVLASVATGFPEKLGKAALPLLRTPVFYEWDLIRSVQEASALGYGYSPHDSFWKMYSEERKTGNQRPWRKENLEHLATRLQFTELRSEIYSILDTFKANIVKLCQDKGDDGWRYRLHRMDIRGWEAQEDKENNRLLLGPQELEPDLQERQQEYQKEQTLRDRFTRVLLWGDKTFNREQAETNYFPDWREALNEAKALLEILKTNDVEPFLRMHAGGIVKASAVFVRDHSAELSEEDLEWCASLLVDVALANARSDSREVLVDDTGYDGSVAAANVLPIFYDYAEGEDRSMFLGLMATALMHSNNAVRCATAAGIREYLWPKAPKIAQALLNAALEYARLQQIKLKLRHRKHSQNEQACVEEQEPSELPENWQDIFVQNVMSGSITTSTQISWDTHCSWHLLSPLMMIPDSSMKPEHVCLFKQIVTMLAEAEESQRDHGYNSKKLIELPDKFEIEFTKRFADYLMTITDADTENYIVLLNQKINSAPDFIHWLFVCLLSTADRQNKLDVYWSFWSKLSDTIQSIAIDLSNENYEKIRHDYRTELIRGLFLSDSTWDVAKPEEYLFEKGLEHIFSFSEKAGVNPIVFDSMSRFLFYLPNVFMPKGLGILIKHQSDVGGIRLLEGVNTVFYLERVLQRLLLRDQKNISFSAKNRDGILNLLTAMMETGSSTAYFLRERLLQSKM